MNRTDVKSRDTRLPNNPNELKRPWVRLGAPSLEQFQLLDRVMAAMDQVGGRGETAAMRIDCRNLISPRGGGVSASCFSVA